MINVTKSFLPPFEDYFEYVRSIYKRNWLTNNGPFVNELELKLKQYLNVPHLLYINNGTTALQLAIKALDLSGEIITTPFSYVATTSSIVWEGCQPVFVDIDPDTFNIDPAKIEVAITPKTSAIMATHVFGNPCDIEAIGAIAKKHNLKVVYDAAHCFGSTYKGKSVFAFGDISITSFHATKLFHTIEGGAVFTQSPELLRKLAYLRNFGHKGYEDFEGLGINGKNSEFHAAMGLANLPFIDKILASRKQQSKYYDLILKGLRCKGISVNPDSGFNYSYYPVVLESEAFLLAAIDLLNLNMIFPRRYFYPSLNNLCYLEKQHTPVSEDISRRIICLPLFHDLAKEEQDMIARLLLRTQNN